MYSKEISKNKNSKTKEITLSVHKIVTKFNPDENMSNKKNKSPNDGVKREVDPCFKIVNFCNEKRDLIRKFQVFVYKNKEKNSKTIEYSTSCDKKITTIDLLQDVLKNYNHGKEDEEKIEISSTKLFLKSKTELFDKFLEDKQELQDLLFDIGKNKNKFLCIVIMDDFFDFEIFLKDKKVAKRYLNLNFYGNENIIHPWFTHLDIEDFNKIYAKKLVTMLKNFTNEYLGIYYDDSKISIIDNEADIYINFFEVKKQEISQYSLRLFQTQYTGSFIKIVLKE